MARQHPGETQGSFVCEGIISKLVDSPHSRTVEFLLENYLLYVLPMVNPDGVDFGSYRSNLSGKDLNRKWDTD
jgi:murein tripeptide amidase MpaA